MNSPFGSRVMAHLTCSFTPSAVPASSRVSTRRRCRCLASHSDSSAWWTHLPEVYVIAFDAGRDEEALYTTQAGGDGTFVAFASQGAAQALATEVQSIVGRPATVNGVPPLALLLLAQEAGYGVEVVPEGVPFEAPQTVRDDTAGAPEDVLEQYTRAAQQKAAAAVRGALLVSLRRMQGAFTAAAVVAEDETTDSNNAKRLPTAVSSVAAALRRMSRARLEALFRVPPDSAQDS